VFLIVRRLERSREGIRLLYSYGQGPPPSHTPNKVIKFKYYTHNFGTRLGRGEWPPGKVGGRRGWGGREGRGALKTVSWATLSLPSTQASGAAPRSHCLTMHREDRYERVVSSTATPALLRGGRSERASWVRYTTGNINTHTTQPGQVKSGPARAHGRATGDAHPRGMFHPGHQPGPDRHKSLFSFFSF